MEKQCKQCKQCNEILADEELSYFEEEEISKDLYNDFDDD